MRKAFTMIELVFVIVVIGILATIAIPKFSATRDDAVLVKAKTTVANIRSSLSSEVQRRALAGIYTQVTDLGGQTGYEKDLFDFFDGNNTNPRVLEYPIKSCKDANAKGCWVKSATGKYQFKFPNSIGGVANFEVSNNRFECKSSWDKCKYLDK